MSHFATDGALGVDLSHSHDSAMFALGTQVQGSQGTVWTYIKASAAIAQYDAVGIDADFTAAPLTKAMADANYGVGFAQIAIAADAYAWVARSGAGILVTALANCAKEVPLYTSATAGSVDDDATSQTQILGLTLTADNGGSAAAVAAIAHHPRAAV
ncbi:hypothetical protein [Magnetofaba australis]|uniref:Uncharacterized protein n=1 Tax=Magnetofaba australis IT-1 TaxID=1434232 RepID=A0A1Y2K3J6_9PROT|nr:hypothetical protein [Magnetofaba australis]OSM03955.1 hypothetical protein MAIT1_03804 [Magnetofaba australis IT-1]